VRIGAPDGFGSAFLAPRLTGLIERHPQLASPWMIADSIPSAVATSASPACVAV
jgi:DNA-binding transcriptional LysR family regulator